MEFITSDYEFAHGRVRGRGSWAFSPQRNPDVTSKDPMVIFWTHSMTYGEAKKAVRAHFKGTSISAVWVLT